MLSSGDAWKAFSAQAERGKWLSIADVYAIVEEHVLLESDDELPISASNRSPRWKRTVRNALQRKKSTGEVEWDGSGRYRLP